MSKLIGYILGFLVGPWLLAYVTWPISNSIFGLSLPVMTTMIGSLYAASFVGYVIAVLFLLFCFGCGLLYKQINK